MVDAYSCLESHVLYGVQATEDITDEDIQYGIQQVMDPWEQGPNYENGVSSEDTTLLNATNLHAVNFV
jgi:hypothetical protein